ncbi:hypothetical protein EB796_001704 [Bugula neritina]|uniref:Uncharacterized protein n=1 Tax=Bugula neritina TaxID=10212 RepID=A0A7J7KPC8_BUGNE|nr:hypothetical protein EB796_001704 [Bugula neritina]
MDLLDYAALTFGLQMCKTHRVTCCFHLCCCLKAALSGSCSSCGWFSRCGWCCCGWCCCGCCCGCCCCGGGRFRGRFCWQRNKNTARTLYDRPEGVVVLHKGPL